MTISMLLVSFYTVNLKMYKASNWSETALSKVRMGSRICISATLLTGSDHWLAIKSFLKMKFMYMITSLPN